MSERTATTSFDPVSPSGPAGSMAYVPAQPPPTPRHPADPDPAPATKAKAVFALGVVALLTGPFIGGVIPAVIALLLAREVRADLYAAKGFLVGTRRYERGITLAWTGIVLALTTIVIGVVRGLYLWALTGGIDFDPNVQ